MICISCNVVLSLQDIIMIQLDFFEDNSEVGLLRQEIKQLRESQDAVRRGMFARLADLSKIYVKQSEEIERLREMMIK